SVGIAGPCLQLVEAFGVGDQMVGAGPRQALGLGEGLPVALRGDVLAPLDRLLGVDQRQEAATICLGIRLHACKIKDRGGEVDQAGEVLADVVLRGRSEEHTSELQSRFDLVCRLLLEKKNNNKMLKSFT